MKTSSIYLSAMAFVGLAMVTSFAAIAQSPIVGTWVLTSHWEKEDSKGKQIVTVNADLTGTVRDVREGWETELRSVELNGDAFSFSFFSYECPSGSLCD